MKEQDIQDMLDFFTESTGRPVTDGKLDVRFLQNGDCRVKLSFLAHAARDHKTPLKKTESAEESVLNSLKKW